MISTFETFHLILLFISYRPWGHEAAWGGSWAAELLLKYLKEGTLIVYKVWK